MHSVGNMKSKNSGVNEDNLIYDGIELEYDQDGKMF